MDSVGESRLTLSFVSSSPELWAEELVVFLMGATGEIASYSSVPSRDLLSRCFGWDAFFRGLWSDSTTTSHTVDIVTLFCSHTNDTIEVTPISHNAKMVTP